MSRSLMVAVGIGALAFGLLVTISLSPAGRLFESDAKANESGSSLACDNSNKRSSAGLNLPSLPRAASGAVAAHGSGGSSSDAHEEQMLVDALRKKPDHIPVLLRMAGIAAAQRQFDKAIGHLNQALEHEPHSTEVRLELGRVLFESGRTAEAIAQTQAILKTDPENAEALYNLGAIYGNLGNREMAEQFWGKLIASKPDSESGRRAKTLLAELRKDPS